MAISELIKYEGDNSTFIWKYPNEDFNCMTELVVHESQEAILFANGQAADTFGPGRYKLNTPNIPILTGLLNMVTGVSVFHCEVYFINKTVQMAIKWGTDSKVRFNEPTLGLPVELGASGEMNLAVSDSRKLLVHLGGTTKGVAWEEEGAGFTKSLKKSFNPLISAAVKSHLPSAIKQKDIDIVEVDEHLMELSEVLREKILPGFEEYGITIPQFYITTIILPEDDPDFKQLKELHKTKLKKNIAITNADIRATKGVADADAEAQIKIAQRAAILEAQATETEIARREAERKIIQAQADAQVTQMAGMAEASVMQAKGYDQKDVLNAEVQKAYAEGIGNMGSNAPAGGDSSIAGDMLGMGVSIAAMSAMAPQVGEMMKGFNPNASSASVNSGEQPASQTVKCQNCGKEMPAGAKFCLECGTKIVVLAENEIICPNCGKNTPKGKFCMECGHPLVNKCPQCGAEVPQGGKFCLECGTKL